MKFLKIILFLLLPWSPLFSQESGPHILLFSGASIEEKQSGLINIPMKILAKNLKAHGFASVQHISYKNNLRTHRSEMIKTAIRSLYKILSKTTYTYDIIAHSMGHYVALAAILQGEFSHRIGKVIGLAGTAKGAEKPPRFCLKKASDAQINCPGIHAMVRGESNFDVDEMYEKYEKQMQSLFLCSLAPKKDPRVADPFNTSFFKAGINYVVEKSFHFSLPALKRTVPLLMRICNL